MYCIETNFFSSPLFRFGKPTTDLVKGYAIIE